MRSPWGSPEGAVLARVLPEALCAILTPEEAITVAAAELVCARNHGYLSAAVLHGVISLLRKQAAGGSGAAQLEGWICKAGWDSVRLVARSLSRWGTRSGDGAEARRAAWLLTVLFAIGLPAVRSPPLVPDEDLPPEKKKKKEETKKQSAKRRSQEAAAALAADLDAAARLERQFHCIECDESLLLQMGKVLAQEVPVLPKARESRISALSSLLFVEAAPCKGLREWVERHRETLGLPKEPRGGDGNSGGGTTLPQELPGDPLEVEEIPVVKLDYTF